MKYYRYTKLVHDRELDIHHEEPQTVTEIVVKNDRSQFLNYLNELNIAQANLIMEGKENGDTGVSYYETDDDYIYNAEN